MVSGRQLGVDGVLKEKEQKGLTGFAVCTVLKRGNFVGKSRVEKWTKILFSHWGFCFFDYAQRGSEEKVDLAGEGGGTKTEHNIQGKRGMPKRRTPGVGFMRIEQTRPKRFSGERREHAHNGPPQATPKIPGTVPFVPNIVVGPFFENFFSFFGILQ